MELESQTTQSSESTVTETPASSVSTETPSQSASPAGDPNATPGTPATPAWQPDFKFKAAGAEHEIDEMFKPLAKDQETLDKIKRMHEKAYGLESLEQNRNTLKKQIAEMAPKIQEYETVSRNFARLSHFVQNGDFDSFFSELRIPEKNIVAWIQQKVEMSQNPALRQQYEEKRRLAASHWDKEEQLSKYKSQAEEYERVQAQNYITGEVSKVAGDIAKVYDEKMGQPNAFVDAVINKGIQITQALGQEPDLTTVINLVVSDLQKLGLAAAPAGTAPSVPASGTVTTQVQTEQKPTIPVIKAGGQSPVKQPVKTMEDLKKIAASMRD